MAWGWLGGEAPSQLIGQGLVQRKDETKRAKEEKLLLTRAQCAQRPRRCIAIGRVLWASCAQAHEACYQSCWVFPIRTGGAREAQDDNRCDAAIRTRSAR